MEGRHRFIAQASLNIVPFLPAQTRSNLHHAGTAAGVARCQDSIPTYRGRIVGVIEHVEEIHVEAEDDTFTDLHELVNRGVLEPLIYAGQVLVAPGVKVVVERGSLNGPV